MSNFQPTAPLPKRVHLYWLDWLRFVSAFMVVAIHARPGVWVFWGGLGEHSRSFLTAVFFAGTRAGKEWVLVFFVLSGFLVGGKLIERLGNGTFNVRSYTVDRITRIWIPLIPALTWSAYVAYLTGKSLSWGDLLGSLAGLQGVFTSSFAENHPLWSLAYEIWFYLLAGCLAVWVMSTRRKRVVSGFAFTVGLAAFTILDITYLFAWVLGASMYWLCHEPRDTRLALLGAMFLVVGYVFSQLRSASPSLDLSKWLKFVPSSSVATLILSLGIAAILPYLTHLKPRTAFGERANAVGGRLAAFSYTLYLTHYPTLYLWNQYRPQLHDTIDLASFGWYTLRITSCLVLGWLLYLPFEKQTSLVRRYFNAHWLPRTV